MTQPDSPMEEFSKKYFIQQYHKLQTVELLQIVDDRSKYSGAAVEAAVGLIKERGITELDKELFVQTKVIEVDNVLNKKIDLHIVEKVLLYVIPFDRHDRLANMMRKDWNNKDAAVKDKIATQYRLVGMLMWVICGCILFFVKLPAIALLVFVAAFVGLVFLQKPQ